MQRGAGCQRIAGDVFPPNACTIKATQAKPPAIGTAHQPVRQREFLGVGGLHYKADAAIGVQQQAARGGGDAIQPIPGQRGHGDLGGGGTRMGGAEDFWLIFILLGVTMSQKSSVTQITSLVP